MAPNQPTLDKPADATNPDLDVLLAFIDPFAYATSDLERPQMFAALKFFPENTETVREDLLGNLEETHYLGHRGWSANVGMDKPALTQFIAESRPFWNEEKQRFSQHSAKVIVPVLGYGEAWNISAGQQFEILPLTRPFGLSAPASFTGKVIFDGKPLADASIRMGWINDPPVIARTPWHEILESRADDQGQFTFTLNQPGWWYCEAVIPAAPLKGPDGEMKPMERSAILWLYVDPPLKTKN